MYNKMNLKVKKFYIIISALIVAHKSTADEIIYKLDDADYYRMPSKYHLDSLQRCLGPHDGVYCTVWADLVSDQPSDLLRMIQAYSAFELKHFNYSNIKYGLCLTGSSCRQFYHEDGSQEAMWTGAEACLNHSLTRDYGLQARVTDADCYRHGHRFETNAVDVAIIAVLLIILALNVVGSIYDLCFRDPSKPGNQILASFSIVANWKRLVAPLPDHPTYNRLRSMNGVRALTSCLVVLGHIPVPTINAAVNLNDYESKYEGLFNQVLIQGHLITLTFFSMSGFLLAYNMEVEAETQKPSLKKLPKAIFDRWLRLSPPNLVVLMLTAVWYKFIAIGPLFKEYIVREATDCRKYWLYNVIYASNLIDNSQCNLQVWFLASDMQLHVMGMAAIALTSSRVARRWALAALYVLGIGYTVYLVYSLDLDGTYLSTPNALNTYFITSPTFNTIFKQSVPNLPAFVIGMCFGYLFYYMQKRNLLDVDYRKYRLVSAVALIVGILAVVSGSIFFEDGPRASLLVRILFAPTIKPLFALCANVVIFAAICRCSDMVRGILEWSGWVPVMRISYCMYLVHMIVLRYTGGTRDALYFSSSYNLLQDYFGMLIMTMLFATLLHLLVEAPFGRVVKIYLSLSKQTQQVNGKTEQQIKHVTKAD